MAGCSQAQPENPTDTARQSPVARRGTNPLSTVGHLAGIEAAGLTGNQRAMRGHVEAMHKNLMRDMRPADLWRSIDHEAARVAVRPLPGVQSAVWIDNANLLVMVGGGQYRSMATIDNFCLALEPLGDTLSVVVNVVQGVRRRHRNGRIRCRGIASWGQAIASYPVVRCWAVRSREGP